MEQLPDWLDAFEMTKAKTIFLAPGDAQAVACKINSRKLQLHQRNADDVKVYKKILTTSYLNFESLKLIFFPPIIM